MFIIIHVHPIIEEKDTRIHILITWLLWCSGTKRKTFPWKSILMLNDDDDRWLVNLMVGRESQSQDSALLGSADNSRCWCRHEHHEQEKANVREERGESEWKEAEKTEQERVSEWFEWPLLLPTFTSWSDLADPSERIREEMERERRHKMRGNAGLVDTEPPGKGRVLWVSLCIIAWPASPLTSCLSSSSTSRYFLLFLLLLLSFTWHLTWRLIQMHHEMRCLCTGFCLFARICWSRAACFLCLTLSLLTMDEGVDSRVREKTCLLVKRRNEWEVKLFGKCINKKKKI